MLAQAVIDSVSESGIAATSRVLGDNTLLAQEDRRRRDGAHVEWHQTARPNATRENASYNDQDDPEDAASHEQYTCRGLA